MLKPGLYEQVMTSGSYMADAMSEHNLLTLDYWQDRVSYEGKTVPSRTSAARR